MNLNYSQQQPGWDPTGWKHNPWRDICLSYKTFDNMGIHDGLDPRDAFQSYYSKLKPILKTSGNQNYIHITPRSLTTI